MASEAANQVCMWSFRQAPPEFQALFPEGKDQDWVVHVPHPVRSLVAPLLLRWQRVYPVKSTELPDGSVAYFGAPREAVDLIAGRGQPVIGPIPGGDERRRAVRVQIDCSSRYETHAIPRQTGSGHTIDMSWSGVSFTTESLLPGGAEVTLHVTWPILLEGNVLVQLRAIGRVTRAEARKAAMQLDSMSFSIGNS